MKMCQLSRKEFILTGTAAALMPRVFAADAKAKPCAENNWGVVPDGIHVRFMGTGAADWLTARTKEEGGYEFRRWTSVLLDNRIFNHSTVEQVADTVKALTKSGAYKPPEGQKVWLTHLAKTLHPHAIELAKTLPDPIKAAYDNFAIVMR